MHWLIQHPLYGKILGEEIVAFVLKFCALPDIYPTSARFLPSLPRTASRSLSRANEPGFIHSFSCSIGPWSHLLNRGRLGNTWLLETWWRMEVITCFAFSESPAKNRIGNADLKQGFRKAWGVQLSSIPVSEFTFILCQGIPDSIGHTFLPPKKNLAVFALA